MRVVTDFGRQTGTFFSDFGRLSSMYFAARPLRPFGTGPFQNAFRKLASFIQTSCGRDVVNTWRGFLLFPTGTFVSHPTDLPTLGRPDQTGSPCIAILWPKLTSACIHLVAPLSPQGRTNRPPSSLCLPSALEHTFIETTDLHLPPVSRIPLSLSTRSIRSV